MDINYSPTDIVWVLLISAAAIMVARSWKKLRMKCAEKKQQTGEPEASA